MMPCSRLSTEKFGIVVYSPNYQLQEGTVATRLGEKLRKLRKDNGYTLDGLAERSGLSKSYLWELENRESQRPSAEKLTAIADVFGLSATFFIDDDIRTPKQQHRDEGFFRDYEKLDDSAKKQLYDILKTFKKK